MTVIITAFEQSPDGGKGWRVTRASAGRLKKWTSLRTFVFFRSGDEGTRASRASSFRPDSDL